MSGSHFESIGIPAPPDRQSFGQILETIYSRATYDIPSRKPFRHVRWTDLSGASVAMHLCEVRGSLRLECATPFFEPRGPLSRWHVKTYSAFVGSQCKHCSGVDCDLLGGGIFTRSAVQLLNFLPYEEWLNSPQEFELEVAAFAYTAVFYETLTEFKEGQRKYWTKPDGTEHRMPFAENAFIPEGMFGFNKNMTQRATAFFAGRVDYSERLTNTLTGVEFQHVRITTLPGTLDTVLDPLVSEGEPAAGNIAVVRAWLVGRPTIPPLRTKKGWGKGIFKR